MYSKNILIPKQLEMEILTCTHYLGLFKDDNDQTLGLTVGNFPYKFFEKDHKYYVLRDYYQIISAVPLNN